MGTAVGEERIGKLLRGSSDIRTERVEWYKHETPVLRIGLWLDPDKAGRKGQARLLATLTLQGHKCIRIRTEKDPKYYSDNQIRDILLAGRSAATGNEEPKGISLPI